MDRDMIKLFSDALFVFYERNFILTCESHNPLCSFLGNTTLIPDFVSSFGSIKASFLSRSFLTKYCSLKI